jgi:oligopeptidase B
MAFNCGSAAALMIVAGSALAQAPPVAKRVEHREVRHEATVVDNYFWLREKSNPRV